MSVRNTVNPNHIGGEILLSCMGGGGHFEQCLCLPLPIGNYTFNFEWKLLSFVMIKAVSYRDKFHQNGEIIVRT